eukprot:Pgem_evm1s17525
MYNYNNHNSSSIDIINQYGSCRNQINNRTFIRGAVSAPTMSNLQSNKLRLHRAASRSHSVSSGSSYSKSEIQPIGS